MVGCGKNLRNASDVVYIDAELNVFVTTWRKEYSAEFAGGTFPFGEFCTDKTKGPWCGHDKPKVYRLCIECAVKGGYLW